MELGSSLLEEFPNFAKWNFFKARVNFRSNRAVWNDADRGLANILGTPSLLFRIIELVLAGAPAFSFLAFFPFMHFTTLFSGVRSVERHNGVNYFLISRTYVFIRHSRSIIRKKMTSLTFLVHWLQWSHSEQESLHGPLSFLPRSLQLFFHSDVILTPHNGRWYQILNQLSVTKSIEIS